MPVLRAGRLAAIALLAVLAALVAASPAHAIDTSFRYEMNPLHNSGKCIEVPGFNTGNVPLEQFDCNGGANQRFVFRALGGNVYEIRTGHVPDKCLDVRGSSQANSAAVLQFDCTGNANQRFRLLDDQPFAGTTTRIQAVHSNKCLDVRGASNANRAPLVQFDCGNQLNQRFTLTAFAN